MHDTGSDDSGGIEEEGAFGEDSNDYDLQRKYKSLRQSTPEYTGGGDDIKTIRQFSESIHR